MAQGDAITHLAAKVSDHSTVLQAMQADLRHMSRTMDHLASVADKQIEIGAELRRHGDSIERAFAEMRAHKTEFSEAIGSHKNEFVDALNRLGETLRADRAEAKTMAEQVTGFRATMRTLVWVAGGFGTLVTALALMFAHGISVEQDRISNSQAALEAKHDTDISSLGVKLDAQGQQVQELRLKSQRESEDAALR